MKTLKIKTRFAMDTAALNDAELGRLLRGMLQYASSGTEPALNGTERALWPGVKADIDKQLVTYSNQCGGMEKTRAQKSNRNLPDICVDICQKSTQISNRNLIDIYQKSNRNLPEEKEEDGERNEKEKFPPHTPPLKEKAKREGEGEKEHPPTTPPSRPKTPGKFIPPTLDDVRAYVAERNMRPQYDAKGQPVRNWKQKLLTWEKFNGGQAARREPRSTNNIFLELLEDEHGPY